MKATTRDNLIYLTVGLTLAALMFVDFFYSESRGREMWVPSWFELHAVGYMAILGYFVATEVRKAGATVVQTTACVLCGSGLHLGVAFTFPAIYGGHLNLRLFGLTLLEFFLIVQLLLWSVRRFKSNNGREHTVPH